MGEDPGDSTRDLPSWRIGRFLRAGWSGGKPWSIVTAVVVFAAGALFGTTAGTAGGTDLRSEDIDLREMIPQRDTDVAELTAREQELRAELDALTNGLADTDAAIAAQQDRAGEMLAAAGLTAVTGPGMTVSLDDAPRRDGTLPAGATVDDVVVHQQDVQAVVNGLWAGGAEAMTIMGERVINTSAVRCVGNTLLLHGRVYSPPFSIAAIGNPKVMTAALNAAPGVRAFRAAVDDFGLGYSVETMNKIDMPAFAGSVELVDAEVPR